MDADHHFARVLAWGFAIVFPFALVFRIRSQATREKLDRRPEGLFILLTLRPAGLAYMALLITYMVNPAALAWASLPLPIWMRWSGVATWALAFALLIWTLATLGKNLTDTVAIRRAHTLVTSGPYRWIRHPFYDCTFLLMLSAALIAANWLLFALAITVFTLMAVRVPIEERKLLERFGEPYADYIRTTGRFLPRR